jgi:transposase InsO family protein
VRLLLGREGLDRDLSSDGAHDGVGVALVTDEGNRDLAEIHRADRGSLGDDVGHGGRAGLLEQHREQRRGRRAQRRTSSDDRKRFGGATPPSLGNVPRYPVVARVAPAFGALAYASSDARRHALPHWLAHYNTTRNHSAISDRPPLNKVHQVLGQDI